MASFNFTRMSSKKSKRLIDEERKPLLVGKSPEIVPGTSGGSSGSPATPTPAPEIPKKSYQSTPTSLPKETPKKEPPTPPGATSTAATGGTGGYQSSPAPSTSTEQPKQTTAGKSSLYRQVAN